MDRITKSLLDEFIEQNSLTTLNEDSAFEHFAGYLVTAGHYQESFLTDDISIGAGGDCGIDNIAIIANGRLIIDSDEITELVSANGYLDITFVFVQAERSSGFSTAKIGLFVFGVCDFFSETPKLQRNNKIQSCGNISRVIFENSRYFKNGNPQCFLYYATTGKWTNDANLSIRRDAAQKDVETLGLFRRIVFECIDAERLQKMYRDTKNAKSVQINFAAKTVIPDIHGVEQAYLGLLPATEYLKLIENESSEILPTIFYDNVRHWQEWNPVNTEIRDALSKPTTKILFPLLNNGITVVARSINPTGNKFLVEDYQIVNGCQTSFVLHECRKNLDDTVMVPIRLIATKDEAIKNAIIKATNRQTEVTSEQLFALNEFPKKLEIYFSTFTDKQKLFYERRSCQYNCVSGIEKVRIVNSTMLLRAFASMFLNIPHRTTRNYKALCGKIGTEIFNENHRLEPYYVSAYANYKLDYLFRNQTIDAAFKPARYHLLMAYRFLTIADSLPPMNSHNIEKYCQVLNESLWHDTDFISKFAEAATNVLEVASGDLSNDNIRTETFTSALIAQLTKTKT